MVGVERYLVAADVFGSASDPGLVARCLLRVPVDIALLWVARMLSQSFLGQTWVDFQRQLALEWFCTPELATAKNLILSGQRQLLAPQVLLQLARRALVHCPRQSVRATDGPEDARAWERDMRAAMLVLAEHLGAARREQDDTLREQNGALILGSGIVTGLELEISANMLANHTPYPPSMFERSTRRWVEIPQEEAAAGRASINLSAEYEAATGVPLADLRMVALGLWARAVGAGGPRVPGNYLDGLGLGDDRLAAVLSLLGASVEDLAAGDSTPGTDGDYEFSVFSRWPLVRLADDDLIVISPLLLLERALGWLPRWDLANGFSGQGNQGRRRAERGVNYLRHATELHAIQTLEHLAAAGPGSGTLYGETAVQAAFGTGGRNADCAIDWAQCWIVAEISSRTVTRETAAATSAVSMIDDLNKGVISKAEQIDATIGAIRNDDESRLTGKTWSGARRRFWPMLVATEGLPMTPVMTMRVREMLRDSGLLQHEDTAPLVVLDIEALEAAETVAERGGPDLPELLEQHLNSPMRDYSFREWLLFAHGPLRAPERIMSGWSRVLSPVHAALMENDRTV